MGCAGCGGPTRLVQPDRWLALAFPLTAMALASWHHLVVWAPRFDVVIYSFLGLVAGLLWDQFSPRSLRERLWWPAILWFLFVTISPTDAHPVSILAGSAPQLLSATGILFGLLIGATRREATVEG